MADDSIHDEMAYAVQMDLPNIMRAHSVALSRQYNEIVALGQMIDLEEGELHDAYIDALSAVAAARLALGGLGMRLMNASGPSATPKPSPFAGGRVIPEKTPEGKTIPGPSVLLTSALSQVGLISSSIMAKRAIRSGVVTIDGETCTNERYQLGVGTHTVGLNGQETTVKVTQP
jgi:ribosome-associated protein YbcJ (S4-like RNA binding protein)